MLPDEGMKKLIDTFEADYEYISKVTWERWLHSIQWR